MSSMTPGAPTTIPASISAPRGSLQRARQLAELAGLPLLEACRLGRQRLGDGGDGYALRARSFGQPLHVRRGVLAVVDPDLDLPAADLAVDGGLVARGGIRAFADRIHEALRGDQLEPETLRERLE